MEKNTIRKKKNITKNVTLNGKKNIERREHYIKDKNIRKTQNALENITDGTISSKYMEQKTSSP